MVKDRPWYNRYPHIATGFRSGLALSTNNYELDRWATYLICEKSDGAHIDDHFSKEGAVLCHKSYVLSIEEFLLRSIGDMPLLVNHKDILIKTLAQWRLSRWI